MDCWIVFQTSFNALLLFKFLTTPTLSVHSHTFTCRFWCQIEKRGARTRSALKRF